MLSEIRYLWFIVLVAVFLCQLPGPVQASEIERECMLIYPKWYHVLDRQRCVKNKRSDARAKTKRVKAEIKAKEEERKAEIKAEEKRKLAEVEAKKKQEEAEQRKKAEAKERARTARICVAEKLPSLENDLENITKNLNSAKNIPNTQRILSTLGHEYSLVPSKEDIKRRVAVVRIKPSCETDFYFLVNINFNLNNKVASYGVWAENPPKGLKKGLWRQYSRDFEVEERRRRNTEARKRQDRLDNERRKAEAEKRKQEQEKIRVQNERRAEEAQKKREESKRERERKRAEYMRRQQFLEANHHCAPGLSRRERLRRLALRGPVLETGNQEFANSSGEIKFLYTDTENVNWCR